MRFETTTVHSAFTGDSTYNSLIAPIYQTAVFRFEDVGRSKGFDYSRTANPTRKALEESLAALEGGTAAVAVNAGMAAIAAVLHLLQSGDHILCTNDCYGGTERLLRLYAEQFGLQASYADTTDPDRVREQIRPNTRVLWIETPSNPLLRVSNIRELSDIAHEHGCRSIVDNTLLTPHSQRPFGLGADIIVHSTSKFLNGHNDTISGAVVVNDREIAERLQYIANAAGLTSSAFDCWLVLRGIKSLGARMKVHEANAGDVARFLAGHPNVARVYYPGLPEHPGHELAGRQQSGFGGIVSFEVAGDIDQANHVLRSTRLFALAQSLGGTESLIEHPATMSHASMKPELRELAGINQRVIRLSLGLEDCADLIEDLDRALRF
jgi:cystathionine gamma-synthase